MILGFSLLRFRGFDLALDGFDLAGFGLALVGFVGFTFSQGILTFEIVRMSQNMPSFHTSLG